MSEIRLKQFAKLDLIFDGELIATATSKSDEKDRWQTLNLFRVTSGPKTGHYVLERLGESRLEGDSRMIYIDELKTPNDVRRRVERKRDTGEKYLTHVALELLDQAIKIDPAFGVVAERL